jgi:proteasome lid subunit RPN8/RPN11
VTAASFGEPTVRLRRAQFAAIAAHCYAGLPDEACGLFLGPMARGAATGVISEVIPCANAAASAMTYTVEPRDMLRASRRADERGEEIVGVWHSHTHTDAYPSPTDVRLAADPAWIYAIVSLKHGEPVLRAYRIVDGEIIEVAVEVVG